MGYRGRLKDVKVDADMEDLVTKFLQREFRKAEQEEKGPAVVIDQRKLEQLKNDSEVVRSLLTVEEALEKDDETDWDNEAVDEDEPGSAAFAAGSRSEEPAVRESDEEKLDIIVEEPAVQGQADSPLPIIDGEADSWTSFASELSLLQRDVLLALAEDDGLVKVNRLAAGGGTMAELLFDEINELAMDSLGDLVIDGEELTEECISMLHYIKR